MEQNINEVQSSLVSIEQIINSGVFYNIPRYQRLYVWEDEQVEILLQDLYEAFKTGKDLFYLGGILIVKHKEFKNTYDLIDGQQRFTTLWLLGLELGGPLKKFTTIDDDLRLKFSIREAATSYFENALSTKEASEVIIDKKNSSLVRIDKARSRIKSFIDNEERKSSIPDFSNFINKGVRLLISEVPLDTDLNKLFEVINNRGEQLQHHEILKASFLKHIENKQERIRNGKIWNACANMEDYIERNMQKEAGRNLSGAYDKHTAIFDVKQIFDLMKEARSRVNKTMTLNSILEGHPIKFDEEDGGATNVIYTDEHPEAKDDELEPVRSILTFPQLLLHTLRIYLFDRGNKDIHRINEKELLYTFHHHCKISEEKEAKAFIHLLWEVRVAFDLYIIKWVKTGSKEEVHLIKKLYKYNQYKKQTYFLQRSSPESNEGFALLQSMLYHSQQIITHYWLTPLLYKALHTRDRELLFQYLRKLDNVLFSSNQTELLTERTWKLIGKELENGNDEYSCNDLDEALGVNFPHYRFYKLEFVLWYQLKDKIKDGYDGLWKNFKLTAKNSVEHISPQNPNYKQDIVSNKWGNRFGNLALVSRSINSEFSNKPFREKRERFLYHNTSRLDSLKLALVYKNSSWNDELCAAHEKEMKQYLADYFNTN